MSASAGPYLIRILSVPPKNLSTTAFFFSFLEEVLVFQKLAWVAFSETPFSAWLHGNEYFGVQSWYFCSLFVFLNRVTRHSHIVRLLHCIRNCGTSRKRKDAPPPLPFPEEHRIYRKRVLSTLREAVLHSSTLCFKHTPGDRNVFFFYPICKVHCVDGFGFEFPWNEFPIWVLKLLLSLFFL